ncbi:MAG TPA: methylenetetrahydrofolate reductase [Acidobacteriota bacterium]
MSHPVMRAGSRLERVLRSGRFAVTAELDPPDSADPQAVYDRALVLASVCDGINATDAAGAHVHMSSVAVSALLTRAGYEPVMQLSCRDRNRIAIQGDLLGAAALGVRNVLCLTGDGVQVGDQPDAKPVFDLDSMTLLRTAQILRDKGQFLSGRKLESPPQLFLGAAENPFAPPFDFRPLRLAKKAEAGADFIQTQFCFDVAHLRRFMTAARDLDLHKRLFILIGVGPLRSAKAAEWIRTKVPGVVIPDEVIRRLNGVPQDRQREEGKRLCVDIIQQVREIPGVSGVHVMAFKQEGLVAEIIEEAGLLPRPVPRNRAESDSKEKTRCKPSSPQQPEKYELDPISRS